MLRQLSLILSDPVLRMAAVGALLFGCVVSSINPFQSLIAVQEFGLSEPAYAGVLVGALAFTVLVSVGIGILTDQRPNRRLMAIVATLGNIGAALLVWLLPAKASFIVAHVVLLPLGGTILGQVLAVARLASQRLDPVDRPGVLAIIRAAMGVPFVLVLPLWGLAGANGMDLVMLYPGLGVFAAVHLVLILRDWPHDATAPWTEVKSGLGFRASLAEMLSGPVLLRVQLMGALQAGGALSGILVGLTFADAGRGPGDVGLFFAAFVTIEVAVTVMVGTLLHHFSRLQLIGTGVVLYAIFLAALPWLAGSASVWLLIVPAGIGGALIYALAITYLADLLGSRAGAGASLLALQRIGQDLTSAGSFWIGGAIGGHAVAGAMGAVLTVAALLVIVRLDRRRV